jgi:TRAP-type uncharacterized transport system substrate-binding protein
VATTTTIESAAAAAGRRRRLARRRLLRLAMASALWLVASGHSPYRQWEIYRKARLVLLTSADDPAAVRLGQAVAGLLAKHLPESRAMMSRARDTNDLVRLIASKQLDAALMLGDDAAAAFLGSGRFADNGGVPLRAIAQFDLHLLVCRDDFPKANAYQVAEMLAERWRALEPAVASGTRGPQPVAGAAVPVHPGALEYYDGHPARG